MLRDALTAIERKALIDRASAVVKKRYGDRVPTERASADLVPVGRWASTGSYALDRAIARGLPGGVPLGPKRGRVVHLFGDPSLGKSLILDHAAASAQNFGAYVLISETEGSRDQHFAKAIGLDLCGVEIQRPDTIETLFDAGLDWIDEIRKKDKVTPILWGLDSLELVEAGKTADKRMSEDGGFHYGGGRAEAIGAGCRKVAVRCSRHPTSFLILNQVREDIAALFGAKKRPSGGKAARFFASVEVLLTSSKYGMVKGIDGGVRGRWVHARVVKNKVAPPFAECDFYLDFQRGISVWSGMLEQLAAEGVVKAGDGREFIVLASGEVKPTTEFTRWAAGYLGLKKGEGNGSAE